MKKLISLILTICLAASMMAAAVYAEEEKPTATDDIWMQFYDACGEQANTSFQTDSMGSSGAVGLKPNDSATGADAWFEYSYEVPADCAKIDFVISYAASGDRYMELTFNGDTRRITCSDSGGWSSFFEVTETFESVKKGEYTVRISAPADFDNDTVKTPNVDIITLNMFYESYEEAPAEEVTEPVTDSATTPETAPAESNNNGNSGADGAAKPADTTAADEAKGGCGSVMSASAVVIAAVAAFGCAVVKKH